jgi:hypothetical protein
MQWSLSRLVIFPGFDLLHHDSIFAIKAVVVRLGNSTGKPLGTHGLTRTHTRTHNGYGYGFCGLPMGQVIHGVPQSMTLVCSARAAVA